MLCEKVRAMLGDKAAQDRFTERWELLPCPCCGGEPKMKVQEVEYGLSGTIIRCNRCALSLFSPDKKAELVANAIRNVPIENHTMIGIKKWNTRAPILAPEQVKMLEEQS